MELPLVVDLTGQVAVITGGGGVLGADFGKAIAKCGAAVAVLDINLEAAQRVAEEIYQAGGKSIAVKANALDKEDLQRAYDEVKDAFGPCTILINGAGGNSPKGTTEDEQYDASLKGVKTFFDLDAEGMKFVLDLNVTAALLTTQVFAKDMAGGKGNIINISSMNAFRPLTKIPAYSSAKAAVSNLTQWLAVYFAKSGVRVNALAPGFFVTNQNRELLFDKDGQPSQRTAKILAATPMGRFGEAQELIGTLLWLLSDKASGFVTGVVIPVDGGFSAYSGV